MKITLVPFGNLRLMVVGMVQEIKIVQKDLNGQKQCSRVRDSPVCGKCNFVLKSWWFNACLDLLLFPRCEDFAMDAHRYYVWTGSYYAHHCI